MRKCVAAWLQLHCSLSWGPVHDFRTFELRLQDIESITFLSSEIVGRKNCPLSTNKRGNITVHIMFVSALETETVLLELSTCLSSLDLGKIETSATTITCINKLHQRFKLISHCYDYDIRRVYLHDMKRIVNILNLLHTTLYVYLAILKCVCLCVCAVLLCLPPPRP